MMTNKEILRIAAEQSAIESNCKASDFFEEVNVIAISKEKIGARKYLKLPFMCDLTSYGGNIVASVSEELKETVWEYINKFNVEHCFETPNMHALIEKLKPYDASVCFMAEYFLPDADNFPDIKCGYETRILQKEDFEQLYLPEWGNALCETRKESDRMGVGAYHEGKLIGLAACSEDCEKMWQIGIDVLPPYRRRGIASALTNMLAKEIMRRGVVPFYCSAWSNVKSVRNALKSGFLPSWVQMTVKSNEFIRELNK